MHGLIYVYYKESLQSDINAMLFAPKRLGMTIFSKYPTKWKSDDNTWD